MLPGIEHDLSARDLAAVLELLGVLHDARDIDDLLTRLLAGLPELVPADAVTVHEVAAPWAPATTDTSGSRADPDRLLLTLVLPSRGLRRITLVRSRPFGGRDLALTELLQQHLPAATAHAALRAATEELPGGSAALTHRERQVLALVAAGRTNRDIGHELYIQPRTVEKHIANIRHKLGARNRTAAAAMFTRTRLSA